MVTVLLGLLVGVGWIKVPLPPNMASNSAVWRTSSILIVLGDPWNLQVSFLHSFFSLVRLTHEYKPSANEFQETY
jgi:hypothetical protein